MVYWIGNYVRVSGGKAKSVAHYNGELSCSATRQLYQVLAPGCLLHAGVGLTGLNCAVSSNDMLSRPPITSSSLRRYFDHRTTAGSRGLLISNPHNDDSQAPALESSTCRQRVRLSGPRRKHGRAGSHGSRMQGSKVAKRSEIAIVIRDTTATRLHEAVPPSMTIRQTTGDLTMK